MRRFLLLLSAGAALLAQDNAKKVHDAEHNDDHAWNAREDSAWRKYLSDKHRTYHDFEKSDDKEQRDYWKWRHKHPNY